MVEWGPAKQSQGYYIVQMGKGKVQNLNIITQQFLSEETWGRMVLTFMIDAWEERKIWEDAE